MTRPAPLHAALAILAVASCRAPDPADPLTAPPALGGSVRVLDTATGSDVSMAAMLDDLAGADVVFLGETHLDETTHRFEHAVYEGLLERRDGKVVLALEMFQRDVQPILDDYLHGRISEAEFLKSARPWGNYRTGYRALIETARKHGVPVVASNAPNAVRFKISSGGREAFGALSEEEKSQVSAELFDGTDDYWFRVDRAVRGHLGDLRGDPEARLHSGQNLWDNTMAESCSRALDAHPGFLVLHVNGGFHSAYGDGTVHQLLLRQPDARVKTASISGVGDLGAAALGEESGEAADYAVFAQARGRGVSGGFHAVHVARELRFRLHLPVGAHDAARVPLLVWLGDGGLRAEHGLERWKVELGDAVAIAVVEPPFPVVGEDLHVGGSWYWADTFDADVGAMADGVEQLVGYALRYFPLDPDHVVLAGEGMGADVLASLAVSTGSLRVPVLCAAPGNLQRLRQRGLPSRASAIEHLEVLVDSSKQEDWETEAEQYRVVGMEVDVTVCSPDNLARDTEQWVREALGLPLVDDPAPQSEREVALGTDSALARYWAQRLARRAGQDGILLRVAGEDAAEADQLGFPWEGSGAPVWTVEDLADGKALPKAPGPFGGTTVLVVLPGTGEEDRAALEQLEADDPLNKSSRFHRLRVATLEELPETLETLREAGRTNVLILPAAFCVSGEVMRHLRSSAGPILGDLEVHWLPGLGGKLSLPAAD